MLGDFISIRILWDYGTINIEHFLSFSAIFYWNFGSSAPKRTQIRPYWSLKMVKNEKMYRDLLRGAPGLRGF